MRIGEYDVELTKLGLAEQNDIIIKYKLVIFKDNVLIDEVYLLRIEQIEPTIEELAEIVNDVTQK